MTLQEENAGLDQTVIYAGREVTVQALVDALQAEVRSHRATLRELAEARNLIAALERDRP